MERSHARERRPWRARKVLAGVALAWLAAAAVGCGQQPKPAPGEPVLTPSSVRGVHKQRGSELRSRGHVVQFAGAGVAPQSAPSGGSAPSPGAPSDTEVRAELEETR